jgi:hypothetical protein
MNTDVVIGTDLPSLAGGGERVLQLARWLTRQGLQVEIIALGEGTRPDLARFRAVAPTTVVDRFRRQGMAAVPHLVGAQRAATGAKRSQLRRWLGRRQGATLLVHHPLAASLVRYAPDRPARVVAALPESSWTLDRLRDEDRATLAEVDGWLTCDEAQTRAVRAMFDGPVVQLGGASGTTLVDRADLPPARRSDTASGAVVLLATIGAWESVDHAAEVAWQVHRRAPGASLRWVAETEDDQWLARHDVTHAGLHDVVQVVDAATPGLLEDVSAVVRTGYEPSHPELVLAAALAGIPVCGMELGDLPGAAARPAFDVEGLVDEVVEMCDDTAARERAGAAARAAVAHLDLDHHIRTVADLIAPART